MENNRVTSIEIAFANAIIVRLINELENYKSHTIAPTIFADDICKLQSALDVMANCYCEAKKVEISENIENEKLTISQINDANTEWGEEGEFLIKIDGVPVAEFGGVKFLKKCLCHK